MHKRVKTNLILTVLLTSLSISTFAQNKKKVLKTMLNATSYMVEEVSTNSGYLWNYLPDFSRQWGEMEAYPTMIWLQHPGTISMGQIFLDAYEATQNEYYYKAAQKAANAIIWGQSNEGGWNYMVDFAGDKSLKQWYATIGKNGWRLEEFQHYYGNCTFDDDITSDAARFLLRIYLTKLDPTYKPALEKAISFILESQYPAGGWPQRYPIKTDFQKQGHPDYTAYYTFNDDVTWENIHFLIQCYLTLGEERFLEPIYKGMDFYIISQDKSGGWGQQLDLDLKTKGARTYELEALLPSTTLGNSLLLIEFYKITGNKKYLKPIPRAIEWLKSTKLPEDQIEGNRTHPTFVELGTNQPIYVHRKGSNVGNGQYYSNYDDQNLLRHYYGKSRVPLDYLITAYQSVLKTPISELIKNSPLIGQEDDKRLPQEKYSIYRSKYKSIPKIDRVKQVIKSLDKQNRWLAQHANTSNPYLGPAPIGNDSSTQYVSTMVGDQYDTSPYRDESEQLYLSTSTYIRNMRTLINYLNYIQDPEKYKTEIKQEFSSITIY